LARVSADGEDVALSAFESFFRGFAAGRFANLSNRDDLWRLLVTITARKARNLQRAERTQKRGGGHARGEAARARTDPESNDILAQIVCDQPTPEFAVMASDRCRELFGSLNDESLRVVALLKLEGYSNEEIARSLDCGLRTVERKLDVIRKRWTAEDAP
jgi:DNA-directed RNA polymerase specialized sigma24 family protein